MSKSLYSLILNDEVVNMVDKMARINGYSRSLMVEKILADAVRYETPEIRANNVFEEIERIISSTETLRYLSKTSQYMASIKSALDYRYNPQIRYNVELFRDSDYLGQLKVNLRTQNPILVNLISDFYTFYAYLEKTYYNNEAKHFYDGVKFTRIFNFPKINMTSKELAEHLTVYVKDFDDLLNIYFNNLTEEKLVLYKVEKRFIELKRNRIII